VRTASSSWGAVAGLVGIEGGVASGVTNLESSGVGAPDWRPRHDEPCHEGRPVAAGRRTDVLPFRLFDNWIDPIETAVRGRVRSFKAALIESGLEAALDCPRRRATADDAAELLPGAVGHAPERLHDEITADYTDMIYAETPGEIETRRKAFIRKWRLKHRAVADSLEEAGERLLAFANSRARNEGSARQIAHT
jgi:hypothetical protein